MSGWWAPLTVAGCVAILGIILLPSIPPAGVIFSLAGITTIIVHPILVFGRRFLGLNDDPEGEVANLENVKLMSLADLQANRRAVWPAPTIGLCESVMYPVSMLFGKPEFIAFWIGLKVVGEWSWWKDESSKKRVSGRTRFYVFLLGNFFSIVSGLIAFFVLHDVYEMNWARYWPSK